MARSDFTNRMQKAIDSRKKSVGHGGDEDRTVETFTFGDLYEAVYGIGIDKRKDARAFFAGYVEHTMAVHGQTRERAESAARSNIGWFFGEGWSEKRIRLWIKACGAAHPVFGRVMPDLGTALKAGLKAGSRAR